MGIVRKMRGGRDNDPNFHSRFNPQGVWADLIRARFKLACKRAGIGRERFELDYSRFRGAGGGRAAAVDLGCHTLAVTTAILPAPARIETGIDVTIPAQPPSGTNACNQAEDAPCQGMPPHPNPSPASPGANRTRRLSTSAAVRLTTASW